MTTSDLLRAAKARLTFRTWAQTAFLVGARECVTIALDTAAGGMARQSEQSFCRAIERHLEGPHHVCRFVVQRWNDAPGRSLVEVRQAFDRAIALAEAQERPPVPEPEPEPELVGV